MSNDLDKPEQVTGLTLLIRALRADLGGFIDGIPTLWQTYAFQRMCGRFATGGRGMVAIILAGGKGTRLRPLTLARPKPVVPLANRPFLSYQLEALRAAGIRRVVLSLSYRPEIVQAAIRGFCPRGIALEYTVEDEPLGTGGAVRFAAAGRAGTLIVLNGDVLSTIDLRAVLAYHTAKRARATIVLTPVEDPTSYGLVQLSRDGRVQGFLEKPSWEEDRKSVV
jgi:NDP-sugar pyrophosphorylase family protein